MIRPRNPLFPRQNPSSDSCPAPTTSWATYEQIAAYFRALDAATPRLRLEEIGRTTEGRTQLMALVSSASNLRNADRYKQIARRLAQGRDLTDEQARALARDGKAVVWINFGLHSTEVGHAQAAPLLAHKVVTAESAEMRFIRDNVIFLLVPNMNPDGTTLVADWYMAHVGTRFEQSTPPELYHTYAGHDKQPGLVHVQHVRVQKRRHAALRRVVPADRLRPAPGGAVSGPHLRPALR